MWNRYEVGEEEGETVNLPVYFRERHSKHAGGSTGAQLFGQPLLITVPKQNLAVDLLYEKVLERIGYGSSKSKRNNLFAFEWLLAAPPIVSWCHHVIMLELHVR